MNKCHYDRIIKCIYSHKELRDLFLTEPIFNRTVIIGIEQDLSYEQILINLILNKYSDKKEFQKDEYYRLLGKASEWCYENHGYIDLGVHDDIDDLIVFYKNRGDNK